MQNIDLTNIDPSALVDINNIKINLTLPKSERILDFISQIKNPYYYKCGKTIIKNTYPKTKATFTERYKYFISGV